MPMITIGYMVPRTARETIPHRIGEATMEARVMNAMAWWDEAEAEWEESVTNDTARD